MAMSKKALANVSALASIGLQAIAAQQARKAWIEARDWQRRVMRAYVAENDAWYVRGEDEPHEEIDSAFDTRRATAVESVRQARRLRALIDRHTKERT